MSANGDGRMYPGSPEDPEERMKRIAAAEAITLLSSRAFRSHICAVPVLNSYPQSKSRTVKKKQVSPDYAIPLTVNNDDCDMPTVVDEVSHKPTSPKMITYQPRVEENIETAKPSQPLPGCDLVIVENSIPIHLMSREELASKRPVKTTSPRHLPPKKRRVHISPPRSSDVPTKKPVPPKTLSLAPVSPVIPKVPLDLSPAVTPEFNTEMAVEYVKSQLDRQLSAIDRRAREVGKHRPGSLTSPLASPTMTAPPPPPVKVGELTGPGRKSYSQLLKRSQSLTMPVSPRMVADGKPKAAEDIVPGSAQAKALTETLRARMMKKDEDGDIALHIAVVHGNVPLVRVLVTLMKSDNHSLDTTNNIKQTALHLSILTEDLTIVRMLLDGGSNPNLGDRHGDNCFHLAVRRQNLDVMRELVEGTKVAPELGTWNNEGFTPLHMASQKRFTPCISYLVSKGADVNAKDGKSGRTSLFHAVEKGDYDTCKHLIKLGASPEISNYAGFTPFAATPKSSPLCVLLSSYFPGKKATPRADQIQGQEFPELKIKQIATPNEVIYKLNGSSTSSGDRKGEVKLVAEGHEVVSTTTSVSSPALIRREIMYPDSFKRGSKPKKVPRPTFKRSDSMPAHLSYSRPDYETKPVVIEKATRPRSPRSYSPVSDASENSNDAKEPVPVTPRTQERFDSPSSIIERARMQKRAFPQPLRLEIPTSSSDERFIPMHLPHHAMMTGSDHSYQPMVQVMTSLEGRLVPTMVPAYAFQHYDMSMHPRPMMYRLPMPHMQMPMYRTMRSPTYPKYRRVKDEPKDLSSPSSAADSVKSEREFCTVAKMGSPIKRPISPEDRRRVVFVKSESATTSEVETEPDEPPKTRSTSDSIVTTTGGEPNALPDSSCPDLPTFGDRSSTPGEDTSPSPSRTYVPFPRSVHSSGEASDNVKIDKKDLMLKIRSKVEARSSPKSPSEKQHAKLARSSSMSSLPVARLAPEELPSVLQDVK